LTSINYKRVYDNYRKRRISVRKAKSKVNLVKKYLIKSSLVRAKNIISSKSKTRVRSRSRGSLIRSSSKSPSRSKSKSLSKSRRRSTSKSISRSTSGSTSKSKSKSGSRSTSKSKSKSGSRSTSKSKSRSPSTSISKTPPERPPLRPIAVGSIPTWKTKLPRGYVRIVNVQYRRKGKVKELNLKTTPNRARKFIEQGVDQSTVRSYRLKIVGVKKGKDIKYKKSAKFRPKAPQGKALPIVEKTSFAIDTTGEKRGLTLKSALAKRRKPKKFKLTKKKVAKPKRKKRAVNSKRKRASNGKNRQKTPPSRGKKRVAKRVRKKQTKSTRKTTRKRK